TIRRESSPQVSQRNRFLHRHGALEACLSQLVGYALSCMVPDILCKCKTVCTFIRSVHGACGQHETPGAAVSRVPGEGRRRPRTLAGGVEGRWTRSHEAAEPNRLAHLSCGTRRTSTARKRGPPHCAAHSR